MGAKKPIQKFREEHVNPTTGVNLLLCLRCEADPDLQYTTQAIGILNGTSVCRQHFEEFMKNQPQYFGTGVVKLNDLSKG